MSTSLYLIHLSHLAMLFGWSNNGMSNFRIIKIIVLSSQLVMLSFNAYPAKLIYLNSHPLEVVSRYRDTQPQVVDNYSYLFNLRPKINKS